MTGTAEQIVVWLMGQDKHLVYDIDLHKERRSLSQNGYYWKLLSILARKLNMSNARVHNLLLRECSSPYLIGGKVAMQPIPDTDEAENQVLESETYHLKPTSGTITGNDGQRYRWYLLLHGSSDFTVEQMRGLLDRLIEDCKEQGIETLSEDELMRIRQGELEHERRMANRTGMGSV
jgi:hypothetical protein